MILRQFDPSFRPDFSPMRLSTCAPYSTLDTLLAAKSETEMRAIAKAETTAKTAKAAYNAAYDKLRKRNLPHVGGGHWRLLPIAGENGIPLSDAAETHDANGQARPRKAITRDEAHFLAHVEKLFMRPRVPSSPITRCSRLRRHTTTRLAITRKSRNTYFTDFAKEALDEELSRYKTQSPCRRGPRRCRQGPVELTHRGRRKYVLMPADHYDALVGRHEVLAIDLTAMSAAEADLLIEGLADPAEPVQPGRPDR